MEVYEAIRTVLAVREFQNKSVPDNSIRKIIESARLTASSKNDQPWHFILIQDHDSLVELGSIVRSGPYTAQAAFAIAVAIEKQSPYGISDASRAIQSMVLTAWAEGIGSNWAGWIGMTKVASYLGVPEDFDVIAVIPFGYPVKSNTKGIKRRKSLSEIAHRERFDVPFN
jgi:nitroreductase